MRRAQLIALLAVLAACGDDGVSASSSASSAGGSASESTSSSTAPGSGGDGSGDGGANVATIELDLGAGSTPDGEGTLETTFQVDGERNVVIDVGPEDRVLELAITHGEGFEVSLSAPSATSAIDVGEPPAKIETVGAGNWLRPRPVGGGAATLHLVGAGEVTVQAFARGRPVPATRRERSLVWTDAAVLDDPTTIGLGRVLAVSSDDGHGGVMLDRWFRRFATTAHSERAAPATLMDEVAAEQGDDPAMWDLDALPFRVTAVHNRLDLADKNGECGEIRVSFGSTDPVVSPLHVLFLFRQMARHDDVAFDGTRHCLGTARRWARMSALDGADFVDAARSLLAEQVVASTFALAETVELTVSPWEWRQWRKVGADQLDNPPLFQTVATSRLNAAGALRDDFLALVASDPGLFDRREAFIPEPFAVPSMQAPPSAPAERLNLTGLDPSILATYPDLTRNIEIVGCPTCHTEQAEFVQTSVERVFSPFYDAELDARAERLDRLGAGVSVPAPPFGPLQD